MLEAVTFALIGLQLRPIIEGLASTDPGRLAAQAGLVLGAVVAARMVWVFPSLYLPRWLVPRIRRRDPSPPWQTAAVLSWAGLRGVISLAAAAALPATVPGRNLLIFLTFAVVLGTLLAQGMTLPWLIRRLGVRAGQEEARADLLAQAAAWTWKRPCSPARNGTPAPRDPRDAHDHGDFQSL